MSGDLARQILGLRRDCSDHPWPLPKPSCPTCARNAGLVHAARLAKDDHCAACECIHEPCGYVVGSMGCVDYHDRSEPEADCTCTWTFHPDCPEHGGNEHRP